MGSFTKDEGFFPDSGGGGGGGGVTSHGDLDDLTADDHTQYILVDGTRAFTGARSGVGFTDTINAIGTAQTVGGRLTNTTAAAAGAQQYSPVQSFIGQGWKTNATAASQQVEFGLQVRPVQGTSAPTAVFDFLYGVNGGALSAVAGITSGGLFLAANGLTATPSYAFSSANAAGMWWNPNTSRLHLSGGSSTLQVLVSSSSGSVFPGVDLSQALGATSLRWSTFFGGRLDLAPAASTSGTPAVIELVTQPAHTGLAIAEVLAFDYDLDATVTFAAAGGATLAQQRSGVMRGTTFNRTTNPLTITEGTTLEIQPPVGTGNASISSPSSLSLTGALAMTEQTAPAGVANRAYLYCDDLAGKTRLMVVFGSGAAIQLAIEV